MMMMWTPGPRQTGGSACAGSDSEHLADDILGRTKLCKFYARGRCKRGLACTFAHSNEELETLPDFTKTQLCIDFFRGGQCQRGITCRFAHSTQEIRKPTIPRKKSSGAGNLRSEALVEALCTGEEKQQLEAAQAQIMRLQLQLQTMTMQAKSAGGAPAETASGPNHEAQKHRSTVQTLKLLSRGGVLSEGAEESDDGLGSCSEQASSLQSTEEGEAAERGCFSSRTSEQTADDSWHDTSSSQAQGEAMEEEVMEEGTAEAEAEEQRRRGRRIEELISFDIVVQNTFVNLVPSEAAPRRRSTSAPPAGHSHLHSALR